MEQLASIPTLCSLPRSRGAFYFFLRIMTELDDMELARALIREHKVAVIPGSAFGMQEGCYLRVAYGALERETVREGIDRLVAGLTKITGA